MPSTIEKIKKRDGRIVGFNQEKITQAIFKALEAVGEGDYDLAKKLSDQVIAKLEKRFKKRLPEVENVQDVVEAVLIENKLVKTAKAYILYREEHKRLRETKKILGVLDELKLPINAIRVLKSRYLIKDEEGKIVESTSQFFQRVARHISLIDILYHPKVFDKKKSQKPKDLPENIPQNLKELGLNKFDLESLFLAYERLNRVGYMKVSFEKLLTILEKDWYVVKKTEQQFYELMTSFDFLPNSPTLMNAGASLGQLSACFVLPVEDDMRGIFESLKNMALVHKSGGGTGFSFSRLRPEGDIVKSTSGVASGPLSFMRIFDVATDVIKQGGKRRGANMGVLRVDHPDILKFITSKDSENKILSNFNISVAITDKFMESLRENKDFELINPRTKKVVRKIKAKIIWDLIVHQVWKTGDPGIIFIDEINRKNQTPKIGKIESTNPCGEQPLLPYESCNLGSVNLSKIIREGEIDWSHLRKIVRTATHFLDNVIDINQYPVPQIEYMTLANRKIGLGIMGWADMLAKLEIPYDSNRALKLAEKVMKFIQKTGLEESKKLARKRFSFPNFSESFWAKKGLKFLRNATITTIAPTGSISIIASASSGIEPFFALAFRRENILGGEEMIETNRLFREYAVKNNFYSDDLMSEVSEKGSLKSVKGNLAKAREIFKTAYDVSWDWHVKMQAAFQKYTDNAVSKTINFSSEAQEEEIDKAYRLAYKLKCKGLTVYRDKSKTVQVVRVGLSEESGKEVVRKGDELLEESEEKCPVCGAKLYRAEGCYTCLSCGYSKCG